MCKVEELTVLVVDSDEDGLHEICDILRQLGLNRLICAPDAESALSWLVPDGNDIDLIIVNHLLSGMDGLLFINHARSLCPNKQIILYSNSKKPTAYLTALNVGATDFIDKDENFASNVNEKLPFWIGVTQKQVKLEEYCCDRKCV